MKLFLSVLVTFLFVSKLVASSLISDDEDYKRLDYYMMQNVDTNSTNQDARREINSSNESIALVTPTSDSTVDNNVIETEDVVAELEDANTENATGEELKEMKDSLTDPLDNNVIETEDVVAELEDANTEIATGEQLKEMEVSLMDQNESVNESEEYAVNEENESLQSKVADLSMKLNEAETENKKISDENKSIKEQLEKEASENKKQIESLTRKVEELAAENELIKKQLEEEKEEKREAKQQNEVLSDDFGTVQTKLLEMETSLTAHAQELARICPENERNKVLLFEAENEIETLTRQVNQAREEAELSASEIESLGLEKLALEKDKAWLTEQLDKLTEEYEANKALLLATEKEKSSLQERNEKLKTKQNDMKKQTDAKIQRLEQEKVQYEKEKLESDTLDDEDSLATDYSFFNQSVHLTPRFSWCLSLLVFILF